MDFYFTGELNKLKEYIDIDSIPFISSQNSIDKTEFKFFTDTVPEAKEFLTEMIADGNFDPEYDEFGEKYVFVVSSDINKFKEELKKAEDIAITAPFFPVDWEPDGSKKYVLGDVLYFENMLDCAKFVLVLMNTMAKRGAFDINPLIIGSEFLSTSETVKVIKSCSDEEIKNVENLKSTLAVFYCNKDTDGIEYAKEHADDMYKFLVEKTGTKMHIMQLFYVTDQTELEYFYWEGR